MSILLCDLLEALKIWASTFCRSVNASAAAILLAENASAPSLPVLTLSSINSDTARTGDLLIGEKFTGDTSQCCAIFASKNTDSAINYILLNDYNLSIHILLYNYLQIFHF